MTEKLSHPLARDAAIKTFDYWSLISSREETFDHAIAAYLIARQISVKEASPVTEPVSEPAAWLVKRFENSGSWIDTEVVLHEPKIGSTARTEITPLYASPPQDVRGLEAENERLRKALAKLLDRDERNTCQHDETHRGGFLWEICDGCGAKWADDEGGKPEWVDPPEWIEARAALNGGKTDA